MKGLVNCSECSKVFDLAIEDEANDFFFGHDCNV
jgi:hypothetical protein